MSKLLHELTFEEYTSLLKSGMMYVYYPDCTGDFNKDTSWTEESAPISESAYLKLEERMDIIGQNGSDGLHYQLDIDLALEGEDHTEYVFVIDDAANDSSEDK